jgi:L-aspartate oxidase
LFREFDVLVIGAGAAGLYTALCLPDHLRVGVISKEPLSLSASDWAQGGIAAVVDPQDSTELHLQDTLRAGAGLCDYDAVQFLVEQAAPCIASLVDMGVGFDRHDGVLALTLEAAHSRRRVLHAADVTGRAVVSTLTAQVLSRKHIQIISGFTLDLWLDESGQRCQGICLLANNQIGWVAAAAVILATGGGGQVFAQTTNPALSTGDGVAIAHRAGAVLRDLEFVQFHPTALTQPGAPRFLISEAVRGEGAHLIDQQGHRFAFDYHPDGELAPRDIVSRSIYSYLQKTNADPASAHVWLDLRPIPRDRIQYRFPNIIQVCRKWGVDVFEMPIPVAPAAHYWMGGIFTDLMNRTSIPGLYAVGETASTGVHGANRLASNSLLECLVFGSQFRQFSDLHPVPPQPNLTAAPCPVPLASADLAFVEQLREDIPRLVWQTAGICRHQVTMEPAIAQVEDWRSQFATLPLSQGLHLNPGLSYRFPSQDDYSRVRLWAETQNLLDVARLILKSANFRTESRGGHFRTDFPTADPTWQAHTCVQGDRWWRE